MPRNRNPLNHDVDNDPLGIAQTTERVEWSLPSQEGKSGQHDARLPVDAGFDYSGGMLVGGQASDADAGPPPLDPHLIRARVDAPHSYELPHEATHRRYETPICVPIAQAAAGFTPLAKAVGGLRFVKLLALTLTLDAAGTIKFVQGPNDGTGISATAGPGDLSGLINMGGAATAMLTLPPAPLPNPWLYNSPDQCFGIFTQTGKAQGWAVIAYSPYDS